MTRLTWRTVGVLVATLSGLGSAAALAKYPTKPSAETACQAALFEGYVPIFQDRDTLPKDGVFAIALQPMADVVFFVRSSGAMTSGYGGLVTFENLPAGRYAIILSQPARLDAVQQRPFQAIPVAEWSDEPGCPGMAEIAVEGGPLTLQLSGAETPSIMVAVLRLPD